MEAELELSFPKDRQNAQTRDIALAQTGRSNIRADIMVVSVVLGLVLCLCSPSYYSNELPEEEIGIILGYCRYFWFLS